MRAQVSVATLQIVCKKSPPLVTTLIVEGSTQDDRYREAAAEYGAALERLARVYEADPDHRRDLLQEIHLALWRSFAGWDARCSLRTWVYRVAHNAATSHAMRQRRTKTYLLLSLEELDQVPGPPAPDLAARPVSRIMRGRCIRPVTDDLGVRKRRPSWA